MKKDKLMDAFKAFEIKNSEEIKGGIWVICGGDTFEGQTFHDYAEYYDDNTAYGTGNFACHIPDGMYVN